MHNTRTWTSDSATSATRDHMFTLCVPKNQFLLSTTEISSEGDSRAFAQWNNSDSNLKFVIVIKMWDLEPGFSMFCRSINAKKRHRHDKSVQLNLTRRDSLCKLVIRRKWHDKESTSWRITISNEIENKTELSILGKTSLTGDGRPDGGYEGTKRWKQTLLFYELSLSGFSGIDQKYI